MIDKIKNEYEPASISHPGETLRDLLEERGITQAGLAERMGRPKKTVNEILQGKTGIIPKTAIQLERVFDIPAGFWLERQHRYEECVERERAKEDLRSHVDWLKSVPIRSMINRGWIRLFKDKTLQLTEVLTFFGVNSPNEWQAIWLKPDVSFRQSRVFKQNPEATSVWLRKGELEAGKLSCEPYNKKTFIEILTELRNLTGYTPEHFVDKVISLCVNAGVAVTFVPRLRGVPIYGVTRWLTPIKALIQLSLRGKFEDLMWFTFFHEAGHILLHGKREVFVEERAIVNEQEKEADVFARNFLIHPRLWKKFIDTANYRREEAVCKFARELDISPAIIVGRLQYERRLPFNHMNDLRRRYEFSKP